MIASYAISERIDTQVILWAIGGAVWTVCKGIAALCSMLVMVAQMLAPHIATLGKALALVAVIVAAVVFAVTCWQFVAGGLVVAAYAYATMPK